MGNSASTSNAIVAAIQMVSSVDQHRNYAVAEELVASAKAQGATLVVLPENFITYGSKEAPSIQEQRAFIETFSKVAAENALTLIAGTYPLSAEVLAEHDPLYANVVAHTLPYAASLAFSSEGNVSAVYTKLHLFDAAVNDGVQRYQESATFRHGECPVTFNTLGHTLGIAVCYDLRFADVFTYFHQQQCSMICFPSAFTATTGEAHWNTLIRARAIETQSFIIAANQGGNHDNGRSTWGESMIVDPWGQVLASCAQGDAVVLAEIDLAKVSETRSKMPIQEHRRRF